MSNTKRIKEILIPVPSGKVMERESGDSYPASHIEMCLVYDGGGVSMFTLRHKPRGYYVHITPLVIRDGCRSWELGRGVMDILLPVARQSKKAQATVESVWYEKAKELACKYYADIESIFNTNP